MVKNEQTIPILKANPLGMNFYCGFLSDFRQSTDPYHKWLAEQMSGIHRFDFAIWLICTNGNSNQLIDFQEFKLEMGNAILIKPQQLRQTLSQSPDFDGFFVSWRDEFLLKSIDYHHLPNFQVFDNMKQFEKSQLFHFCELLNLGLNITDKSLKINYLQSQFSTFLYFLQTQFPQNLIHTKNTKNKRFQLFMDLLEQYFSEYHQVNFYADKLACSPKTLNLTCQNQTGLTCKTLINNRILLESKRLLVHTHLSANQIGRQLGFAESTHFAKFFKQNEEITANQFRQKFNPQSNSINSIKQNNYSKKS